MAVTEVLIHCFEQWQKRFLDITARAPERFERADWHGLRADSQERLDAYDEAVALAVAEIGELDRPDFVRARNDFSAYLGSRDDWEIGETFFNSVVRKVLPSSGVEPDIAFVSTDYSRPPRGPRRDHYYLYEPVDSTVELAMSILTDFRPGILYEDLERDSKRIAEVLDGLLQGAGSAPRVEVVRQVFYRGQGAYIIGHLHTSDMKNPMVISLRNRNGVARVDACLVEEDDVSILFSFTRSYFHVNTTRPYELVRFLQEVLPNKRLSELYNSIGYHKHGKTELYREIRHYVDREADKFVIAPGTPGLVMVVFTMPELDLVFKVMRDRFGAPKQTTPYRVREKYRFVFRHDRAGRLIDTRNFEGLALPADAFDDDLLAELLQGCGRSVRLDGDRVVFSQAYVARRVVPLDVHIRTVGDNGPVLDYGQAIKDMAATDIFPGDLLTKNFGLTRHGRVVFYDYDELTRVTTCNFRRLPEDFGEPTSAGQGIGPDDVFPEEFPAFLGLPDRLKRALLSKHGEIFDPVYWQSIKRRLQEGELIEIQPYRESVRFDAN